MTWSDQFIKFLDNGNEMHLHIARDEEITCHFLAHFEVKKFHKSNYSYVQQCSKKFHHVSSFSQILILRHIFMDYPKKFSNMSNCFWSTPM